MKKYNLIIIILFFVFSTNAAQNIAFNAEQEVKQLRKEVTRLDSIVRDKDAKLLSTKKEISFLTTQNTTLQNKLDSVDKNIIIMQSSLAKTIDEVNKSLGTQIQATTDQVTENKASTDKGFHSVLVYGIIGLLLAIITTIIIYYHLRKRIGKGDMNINAVKKANEKLTEQSVALDNKLAEILEIQLKTDENIKNISSKSNVDEIDHSLVLSIVNEIMRIEQNISFMDPKTKGVSQLKNRAAAISASLKAKDYEIPNLINTEYKEGMNYEAVMEEDEEMEPGIMRIKRVTKPCVMYKGKMIQTAKVVVAYNPNDEI